MLFLRSEVLGFLSGRQRISAAGLRFFQPTNQKSIRIPISNGHVGHKGFVGCQIELTQRYQQRKMSSSTIEIPFYAFNISCKIPFSTTTSPLHQSTFTRVQQKLWEFIRSGYLVTKLGECRLGASFSSIFYSSWLTFSRRNLLLEQLFWVLSYRRIKQIFQLWLEEGAPIHFSSVWPTYRWNFEIRHLPIRIFCSPYFLLQNSFIRIRKSLEC